MNNPYHGISRHRQSTFELAAAQWLKSGAMLVDHREWRFIPLDRMTPQQILDSLQGNIR